MRDLTKNTVVYGECTPEEQKAFQKAGRTNCEYRGTEKWVAAAGTGPLSTCSTYRIKIGRIVRKFVEYCGVLCLETGCGYVVYSCSHAVVLLDGEHVRFLGYRHGSSADIRPDIFSVIDGTYVLPISGVWEVIHVLKKQ